MDIFASPSGRVIKLPQGYSAFIPNALPPILEWDTAIVNSLSQADFLLGKLAREGSKVAEAAQFPVEVVVGPEFVTGSTNNKT